MPLRAMTPPIGTEPEVILHFDIQADRGLTSPEVAKAANGKAGVTIEILAPNRRPIQITRDLNSFWKETYPKIKPELSRRYPKHKWQ